jgi:hypothetical protein
MAGFATCLYTWLGSDQLAHILMSAMRAPGPTCGRLVLALTPIASASTLSQNNVLPNGTYVEFDYELSHG